MLRLHRPAGRQRDRRAPLFLAEKTVRNRVTAILATLEVRTRAEAIARARDAGVGASE